MPSKKLRPCPFCGEAKDVSVESLQPSWWIHCASCGGAGPMRELGALAEKAWNRRAGPEIELSPDIRSAASEPDWEIERLRKALRVVLAARPSLTEKGWEVVQEALGEVGREPETCVWKIDCPGAEYASPGCRAGYANIKNGVPEKCPRCGKRVEVQG